MMKTNYHISILVMLLSVHPFSIEDGWYEAAVRYTNSGTGESGKYGANVLVQADRVVTIDFGEGGSVSAGNNQDYSYSGGRLAIEEDWSANVAIAAKTTVTVTRKDGNKLRFEISLKSRARPKK